MTQQSRSSEKNVAEAKRLQIDTILQDDLNNTNNSVGLVDPSLVDRLSENSRDTSKGKIIENRAAIIKTVVTKTKKQATLDSYWLSDKISNKVDVILPTEQCQSTCKKTVNSSVGKIAVSITTPKSTARVKRNDNGEWKPNVVSKRVKKISKKIKIEGQGQMTDFLPVSERTFTLQETPIESMTIEKVESMKVDKQIEIISSVDFASESFVENENHEESPSTYSLSSIRTHEEPSFRSLNDFSIENMDWYHENQDYYEDNAKEVLSDFAILENRINEMSSKLCYTYLLLDGRRFKDTENISWMDFIEAIFYIGKGTGQRAYKHAKDTEKWLSDDKRVIDKRRHKKYLKIQEIWESGNPVKVLFVTENIIKEEAFTREAAMIDAMGMKRLCNLISGCYHGVAETLKVRQRLELGATLLMEANEIFNWKNVIDMFPSKMKFDIVRSGGMNVICDNVDFEGSVLSLK